MSRLVACAFLFLAVSDAAKLPKGWTACKTGSPDRKECLKKSIETAVVSLRGGKKSLGVFPIDPFHLDKLVIEEGTGPVKVKIEFVNADMLGLSQIEVVRNDIDWDAGRAEFGARFLDTASIIGDYIINGQVLILPISGKGKCNISLSNLEGDIKFNGKQVKKNGQTHYQITDYTLEIDSSRVYFYFENLFNGDKRLGDNMNKFLNENWKEIFNEIRRAVGKGIGGAIKEVASRVFDKIPLSEIDPNYSGTL